MRYCACGCESLVKGTWAPGHNKRKPVIAYVDANPYPLARIIPAFDDIAAPPPHPHPFDHGAFRIAEEPPGTDMYAPWVQDVCIECRGMLWTHNAKVAEKHESICETCAYLMFSDLADLRVKNESRVKPFNNPFES